MKVSPFVYFWYRLLYPKHKIYLDEGLGIEARFRTQNWTPHLSYSKQFVEESLRIIGRVKTISVLGAGRLYDCDLELLSQYCEEIILVDADPRAKASWPKEVNKTRITHSCIDITVEEIPKVDVTISLNIKSQLSVLTEKENIQKIHWDSCFEKSRLGVVFIFDDRVEYLKEDQVIDSENLNLVELSPPRGFVQKLQKFWDWEVERNELVTIHKVIALCFESQAEIHH